MEPGRLLLGSATTGRSFTLVSEDYNEIGDATTGAGGTKFPCTAQPGLVGYSEVSNKETKT